MSCNNCIEIEQSKCDAGCNPVVETDCIFHNTKSEDAKLFNLGITKGTSLKYILKQIDRRLELLLTTDFSSFNMSGLFTDISTIKQFSEAVAAKLLALESKDSALTLDIADINEELSDLLTTLDELIAISISDSELDINTTDDIKEVIEKIIAYIKNIPEPEVYNFLDSPTIQLSSTSNNDVLADLVLSQTAGQSLQILDDGLYHSNPSVSSILNAIKNSTELTNLFLTLITFPSFKFDIMSDENRPIKYINNLGIEVTTTAKSNTLLKLTDVKEIITPPSIGLTITFKGI